MKYILTYIFICIIGSFSPTALNAQEVLVLGAPPPAHPMHGIALEILTKAYDRIGLAIETSTSTAERSQVMSNSGQLDGQLFRGALPGRTYPNLIKVPVVLDLAKIVVFTKNAKIKVSGWPSLAPYTLGVQIGLKDIETQIEGYKTYKVKEPEQLFKMLIAGRIDVIVLPWDVGIKGLNNYKSDNPKDTHADDIDNIVILEPPLEQVALHHYLHVRHAELVPKITLELQKMEQEGEIERIKERARAE